MSGLTMLPIVWAQAAGASANSLAPLALRRWYSSLTLSSPESVPSLFGLWSWLAGLAALLLLTLVIQGPGRALRQVFDLPGHVRLVSAALGRIRRSWRVVAVTIGMTVIAWTAYQGRAFNQTQGKDDLILLTKSRGLGELATEQGILAGLTAGRDVFGLGDNLPLLIIATLMLFRSSADRWGGGPSVPVHRLRERSTAWETTIWGATSLYILYRFVNLAARTGDLPLGGCLMLEVAFVPLLMVLSDGILLAWVLVELRNANLGETGNDTLDPGQAVGLMPGAALACLVALPARYMATAVLLALPYLPGSWMNATRLGRLIGWQLKWGLADLQGAALVTVGLAGAVAWTRGTFSGAVRGYLRLISAEGGHLVALLILTGVTAGTLSALAYLLVLALPSQSWVLAAADGYAHYATLPIGLLMLAALVELGERSLPTATLITTETVAVVQTV